MNDTTQLEVFVFFAPTLFPLGQIVSTPGALAACSPVYRAHCLNRHAMGDWGNTCDEDKETNNQALIDGDRVLSAYTYDPWGGIRREYESQHIVVYT
jgi:hypothetical protein